LGVAAGVLPPPPQAVSIAVEAKMAIEASFLKMGSTILASVMFFYPEMLENPSLF
jgi:hypothetical protein